MHTWTFVSASSPSLFTSLFKVLSKAHWARHNTTVRFQIGNPVKRKERIIGNKVLSILLAFAVGGTIAGQSSLHLRRKTNGKKNTRE
jgi:hypothetical protein